MGWDRISQGSRGLLYSRKFCDAKGGERRKGRIAVRKHVTSSRMPGIRGQYVNFPLG